MERIGRGIEAGDGSTEMNRLSTLGVNNHNGWGGEKGGRDLRSLRHTRGPTVTCPIQHLAKRTDLSRRLSTVARTPARVTGRLKTLMMGSRNLFATFCSTTFFASGCELRLRYRVADG